MRVNKLILKGVWFFLFRVLGLFLLILVFRLWAILFFFYINRIWFFRLRLGEADISKILLNFEGG